jgi:hypothetical protein
MRPGPAARPTRAPPGQRLGGILDEFRVCTAYQDAAHFVRDDYWAALMHSPKARTCLP